MSNRLDKAIAEFEDETLDLPMLDRLAILRKALFENAFRKLKKLGLSKNSRKEEEKEEYVDHKECMKLFNDMEKMYSSEFKMNRLMGKTADSFDKDFLKMIKEEKGSMSDIVRDLKDAANG